MEIDDERGRALLAAWPELVGRPWRHLEGGLRSSGFRVGDDLVLRVASSPEQDLEREAALHERMAGRVRVPRVRGRAPGALLLEHVPHAELPDTAAAGGAAGRAAARIHAFGYERSGFLDAHLDVVDPFPDALTGLLGWTTSCLAGPAGRTLGPRVARVRDAWQEAHAALVRATERPVLLHADFKPANVKWLPGEGDVVVFDWEFSWAGPALMDVGQMFRWGASAEFTSAFASAYRAEGGTMSEGWARTAALLDLFNLVGLLDHLEPMPRRDGDLLDAVDRTLGTR